MSTAWFSGNGGMLICLLGVAAAAASFLRLFLPSFQEVKGGKEREGEKHQSVASCMAPNRGLKTQPRHIP